MSLIEDRLIDKLLNCAAVTAICGNRIRPGVLAQADSLPAVTVVLESETPQTDLLDGGSHSPEALESLFVVSAISTSHRTSRLLQKAIQRNGTSPGTGLAGFTDQVITSVVCLGTTRVLVDLKDDAGGKLEVMETRYLVTSSETP